MAGYYPKACCVSPHFSPHKLIIEIRYLNLENSNIPINRGDYYYEIEVEGANHFFPGNEAVLVGHVIKWPDQQVI
jgi:hypothetical protein